uniref:Na_Ca_ex domain-containing protein n=1 Tax=Macrostomum lignano TaxID=282301 RepID=A0A1I8GQV8_9PLAT
LLQLQRQRARDDDEEALTVPKVLGQVFSPRPLTIEPVGEARDLVQGTGSTGAQHRLYSMARLFRATARKGQWNRALDYGKAVPRPRPLVCCLISMCLITCLWLASRSATAGIILRRLHGDDQMAKIGVGRSIRQPSVAAAAAAAAAAPGSRRLLSASSSSSDPNATYYNYKCERKNSSTKAVVAWETCDTEKATGNLGGWIVLYIVCTIIIFIAVAIVCDDFFVPSLEIISEKLNLSEDVAGATFMAAGSSAPELFSSVAAVAFDSDAGVGTIAGSAVFNLLVIISLTAAFAGKELIDAELSNPSILNNAELLRELTEEEEAAVQDVEEAAKRKSTTDQTALHVKRFKKYLVDQKLPDNIETMPIRYLCAYMRLWFVSLRTQEGKPYAVRSLVCFRASIHRYVLETRNVLHLDWRPLVRDSIFYLISIIYFIVMMYDSVVQIWDAVVLLVLYIVYIVLMVLNPRLMNKLAELEKKCRCQCRVEPAEDEEQQAGDEEPQPEPGRRASVMSASSVHSQERRHFRHDRRNSVLLNLHSSPSGLRTERRESVGQSTHDLKTEACIIPEEKQSADVDLGTHEVKFNFQDFDSSTATLKEEDSTGANSNGGDWAVANGNDNTKKKKKPGSQQTSEDDDADGNGEGEGENDDDDDDDARIPCCACCACCPDIRGAPPKKSETMTAAKWAIYVLKWIVFVLAFPFLCLFSWTVPECSKEHLKKFFIVSFLISVLWIAALSFGMVTVVARLGCLLGVDTFVMSLVVLAAGTSVPDLLSSIIVARDGFGDMAVSNAIGSNVFDINMGLGLPFFIRLCINKIEPLDMFSDDERRSYCEGHMNFIPHVKFGVILIILLVLAFTVISIAKFRLGKIIGVSFFCTYVAFLVYAFCQEFLCEYNC